ncbi:MAG TPA: hypothetical protein VGC71_07300 [Gaiellales bacterium]|jgi:hypothetical protein
MMQRIWAAIAATWAVIAIFAVLAFSHRAPAPSGGAVVLTRSPSGKLVPASPSTGASHATTGSSGVATGAGVGQTATYVRTASGAYVPVSSAPTTAAAVTRSS